MTKWITLLHTTVWTSIQHGGSYAHLTNEAADLLLGTSGHLWTLLGASGRILEVARRSVYQPSSRRSCPIIVPRMAWYALCCCSLQRGTFDDFYVQSMQSLYDTRSQANSVGTWVYSPTPSRSNKTDFFLDTPRFCIRQQIASL